VKKLGVIGKLCTLVRGRHTPRIPGSSSFKIRSPRRHLTMAMLLFDSLRPAALAQTRADGGDPSQNTVRIDAIRLAIQLPEVL
jgi:hypothetical protein